MPEICQVCKGAKIQQKFDFLLGSRQDVPCVSCMGTGLRVDKQQDGLQMTPVTTLYYRWLVAGETAATLQILMELAKDSETKLPVEFKKGAFHREDGNYVYLMIVNMVTKPQYRRQGIMKKMVEALFADHRTLWIETSAEDSTDDGKAFCISNGFVVEGDKLIKRKEHAL